MKYNFNKKYNHYGGDNITEELMKGTSGDSDQPASDGQDPSVGISSDNDHNQQNENRGSCQPQRRESTTDLSSFNNDQDTTKTGDGQPNEKKCEDNMEGEASKVKLPFSEPSRMKTYTITKGTILYHGSKSKETFNPYNIKLGSSNLIVFFSPDKELAAHSYGSCSNFPVENGYLHEFRVTRDIENIIILSVYDLDNTDTIKKFEDRFCSRNNVYDMILDGIGFFYPSDAKESPEKYTSEFALCNPKSYLEYIGTQRCISRQILGESYKFNKA